MVRSFSPILTLILAASLLGGCTDLRRALGLEKAPPDEFAVTSVAPLTLPPDYGLRPPHSTGGRPATPSPAAEARTNVFSLHDQPALVNGVSTPGEQALLSRAGANATDPHIRDELNAEVNHEADASPGFVDSLLFWEEPKKQTDALDSTSEAERLKGAGTPGPGQAAATEAEKAQKAADAADKPADYEEKPSDDTDKPGAPTLERTDHSTN